VGKAWIHGEIGERGSKVGDWALGIRGRGNDEGWIDMEQLVACMIRKGVLMR
jgi:hypothetical protein